MITVAQYIAKFLKEKEVKHVFGFQGSAMLKMLDEIVGSGIEYIQNFNEQASSFAADAYARVNGNIGVAIATSGPGAVNLIGGIANAYFDSVPVMFITGQDYTKSILSKSKARQNGFQDMDIVSVAKPITKYAVLLNKAKKVRYELERAYYLATTGRKGSVLIDVPIDVQFKQVDENKLKGFKAPKPKRYKNRIKKVLKMIKSSKKPVILAGGGIRGAGAIEEFRDFIKKTKIPVVSTLNGIDVAENIVGFSGLYGNTQANLAVLNSDLIIAVGSRFSVKQIGRIKEQYSSAKVIQIEIDKKEIKKTFMKPNLAIRTDIKSFLHEINKHVIKTDISEWKTQLKKWCKKYENTVCMAQSSVDPINLLREITKEAPKNAVFCADVGANQMWTAQGLRLKDKQRLLNSAGFGAMGYSLPASIGASYLNPAVSITGDGGFQMNLQELNTLSLRQNNVKCFVINNNNLSLMRDTQKRYYNSHFYGNNEQEFSCPDIKKLADTFNLKYAKIKSEKDFEKLKDIFSDDKPCLVDVIVDKDTKVLNRYDDEGLKNG